MTREKKIVQTSLIGILANVLLVGLKAFFGFLANSVSIILDAVNNLSDALSSTITIIGTKLAHKKPDAKHPYGHGRVEYITSLIIAIIILVTGGAAIYQGINTIINPVETHYTTITLIIVGVAIVVKIALGLYFRFVGKKVNSGALVGSGLDALFDALLSVATLVGILTAMIWKINIEGYLGILIGLFILKSGIDILRESFSSIIGERTSEETALGIKQIVTAHQEVIGAYDLIVNNYGPERAIGSIHIEVNDELTAKEIHALSRSITEEIYIKYNVIMTVGVYASNTSNEETKEIRAYLSNLVKEYQDIKQLHGFYVDKERMLISFDIILDYKCPNVDAIKNELYEKMKEKFPLYNPYIIIDNEFSD